MKYESPKFENISLEAKDLITASGEDKDVTVDGVEGGNGEILIGITSLFGK